MKKLTLLAVLILCFFSASSKEMTVTIEEPGTFITVMGADRKEVTSLIVLGNINKLDLINIKATCNLWNLRSVDLTDAYLETINGEFPNAFAQCDSIHLIKFPRHIKSIDETAFMNCRNLTTVVFPEGLEVINRSAFGGCSSLLNVVFPSSLRYLGSHAFALCGKIREVYIPRSVEFIDGNVFIGCDSIREFNVDVNNRYYKSYRGVLYSFGLDNLISYPNKLSSSCVVSEFVKSIGESAFWGCYNLEIVDFSSAQLSHIGSSAFSGCMNLKSIDIPQSVDTIHSHCFSGTGIEMVNVSDNLKFIGLDAFSGCEKLKNVYLGSGLAGIKENPFNLCRNLRAIHVSGKNKNYTSIDGVLYTEDCKMLVSYPNAKSNRFEIPYGVEIVGAVSFCGSEIESIVLPETVVRIKTFAFFRCDELKEFNIQSAIPPILEGDQYGPFDISLFSNGLLYIPKGSLSKYKSATVWKEFQNIIEKDFSVSNEILFNRYKVYSASGSICIEVDVSNELHIYSISGNLIKSVRLSPGSTRIPVTPGIYIVKCGSETVKVAVE